MKATIHLSLRLLAGVLLAATPMGVQGEEFKVGDVSVELLAPEGMVRIDGVNEAFDTAPKRKAPNNGVTLAIFGSAEDLAVIKAGKNPEMASEYAVFAMAPEVVFSAEQFGEVITSIEKVQGEMVTKAKAAVKEWKEAAGEAGSKVEFGEPTPLGVTGKGGDWVSFGIIVNGVGERDGKEIRSEVLSYNTLLHHRGKILGLRLTAEMLGGVTVDGAQEAVDAWRVALVGGTGEDEEVVVVVEEFDVKGAKIKIPTPPGFVRMNGISEKYDQITLGGIAPSSVLMGYYGTPAEVRALKGGVFPTQVKNFNAQVIQAHLNATDEQAKMVLGATEKQLTEGFDSFRENMEAAATGAGDAAADVTGTDVKLKLGETVPLGILGKGDGWLTFGMRMAIESEKDGEKQVMESTVVSSMLAVGGKMVALYATGPAGDDSLEILKRESAAWKDAVIEANAAGRE